MKTVRELLAKLKQTKEEGTTLLENTMVFLGSNLGDASSHSVKNLPVFLAGGGFRHYDPCLQGQPPFEPGFAGGGVEQDRVGSLLRVIRFARVRCPQSQMAPDPLAHPPRRRW